MIREAATAVDKSKQTEKRWRPPAHRCYHVLERDGEWRSGGRCPQTSEERQQDMEKSTKEQDEEYKIQNGIESMNRLKEHINWISGNTNRRSEGCSRTRRKGGNLEWLKSNHYQHNGNCVRKKKQTTPVVW